MADWTIYSIGNESLTWNEFVDYFWSLPLYGQVLTVIGVITLLTLLGIGIYYLVKGIVYLVYYILKGVAYLVYYIILGVSYLLYGIGLAFYKLFEWLYYAISGKEKPIKQEQAAAPQIKEKTETIEPVQKFPGEITHICPGCGIKISNRMTQVLAVNGTAYCEHCGKGLKTEIVEIETSVL